MKTKDNSLDLAAVLAEVERLQQELAESQEWQAVFDTGRVEALDRAEAAEQRVAELEAEVTQVIAERDLYVARVRDAEQVAREAVALLERVDRLDLGGALLEDAISNFLLHHGARTGESDEN